MLSIGSRDGRKGLGFGEMEETELEEGEASYYQDDDASIDPDVALSYLDEKLQDVLGHFQKDFEGGVSAENLGAKFGDYGSFLPAYQRSLSIRSQPRTPQKVQLTYVALKSPNNLPSEGVHQNHATPACASHPSRTLQPSGGAQSGSTIPYVDNSVKRDLGMSTAPGAEEFTPKHDFGNKSLNASDIKTLKVRIKMGFDSAKKNAQIYSGLGLDISPSPSLEDSSDGGGGLSPEVGDAPDESPMTVLKIVAAFTVPKVLHSPLLDSLLHLTEKGKPFPKRSKPWSACKGTRELLSVREDEPSSAKNVKGFAENKMKSSERNGSSLEGKIANDKDVEDDMSALLKKEIDIETEAGKEPLCNALKTPLLSHSSHEKVDRQTSGGTLKGTGRAFDLSGELNKGLMDIAMPFDLMEEEEPDSIAIQENNGISNVGNEMMPLKGKLNSKTSSAEKAWDERKPSSHKEFAFDSRKDGKQNGDKIYDPAKVDPDGAKARKDHSGGSVEPSRPKVSHKAMPYEEDGLKMSHANEHLPGSKRKLKGNQADGTGVLEFPKESSGVNSSAASKDKKKSFQGREHLPENKSDASRYRKESSKPGSREFHRDALGDMKAEQVDDKTDSPETHVKDKSKDSKLDTEKETHEKSKERLGSRPIIAALPGNGPPPEVVTAPAAAVVIEENWVACDRCQKWRLLPYGTNPDHLPKKWLCSMLNWLPGMNKCTLSEEETTKALHALYQVPAPDSQNNLHIQHGTAASVASTNLRHLDLSHELSSHSIPAGGKKKPGSKDASIGFTRSTFSQLTNSTKKSQQVSVKSRSLNDVHQDQLEPNSMDKGAAQHTTNSNDFSMEKQRHKPKDKHQYSDGGDYTGQSDKLSNSKSKRQAHQDGFKASKKIKTEVPQYSVEDWHSDHDMTGSAVANLSNGLLTKVFATDQHKHSGYSSSKDSRGNFARDNFVASGKKLKAQTQDGAYGIKFGSFDMGRSDKTDFSVKKRKVKEWQESQSYLETLRNGKQFPEIGVSAKEELSESEHRKEKKVSKSEGKDARSSKSEGKLDGKGRVTKILLSGNRDPQPDGMEEEGRAGNEEEHQMVQYRGNLVSEHALECMDSLQRDLGCAQPTLAATSSSSKVSGSWKSKANFQEVKGSPVESVSSSPLRISNTDRLSTARRNLLGKDDTANFSFSTISSPRRCSDGEGDGGRDPSGLGTKDQAPSFVEHEIIDSHRASESLGFDSLRGPHDIENTDANQISTGKAKGEPLSKTYDGLCGDENINVVNDVADITDQHNPHLDELRGMNLDYDKVKFNSHHHANGSSQWKSCKASSTRSKDRHRSSTSDNDKGKIKVSDSFSEQEDLYPAKCSRYEADVESQDHSPCNEDLLDGKPKCQEKYSIKSEKNEKNYSGKNDFITKRSNEGRSSNQSKSGAHESGDVQASAWPTRQYVDPNSRSGRSSATYSRGGKSNAQQNLSQVTSCEDEKLANRFASEKNDRAEGKMLSSSEKKETQSRGSRAIPLPPHKGSKADVDASNGDAPKVPKHCRKPDNQNGSHHSNLKQPIANGIVGREIDAPSPLRKESGQTPENALKEAKDLKHSADRLKNGGLEGESTTLYFQAALKFLHAASLLEPCNVESARYGETTRSMQVYTDTARLCEFCAHEYERYKDMAGAALAYKCMEVAYMRVIFSKHSCASKDRHELQAALQMVPPGESPSSSASDGDNLNNQTMVDQVALVKHVNSPQVAGNPVIVARSRPSFIRLLNFAQDVNSAMDALRKSQNAFAAANLISGEANYGLEGLSSVRRVLDLNFYDVEGLLRLVRLAMEAISR